jgi:hypothetical protein
MGLRVLLASTGLIESLISCGTAGPLAPVNVPRDLEVLYVRLNVLRGRIECLVRSQAFEGGELRCGCEHCLREALELLPPLIPIFKDPRVEDAETAA